MTPEKKMMKMEWRNHMLMRALIGIIVIVFVFWCGMQLGELREAAGLDHGMMMGDWSGMRTTSTTMGRMIPAGSGTTTVTPVTTTGAVTQ